MSLRPSIGPIRACSGLMYRGVPSRLSCCVRDGSARRRARPKSAIQTIPRASTSRFDGLTSRWMTPRWWRVRQRLGRLAADLGDPAIIRRPAGGHERRRLVVVAPRGQAEAPPGPTRARADPGGRVVRGARGRRVGPLRRRRRRLAARRGAAVGRPGGGRPVAAEVAEHAVEPAPLDPLHRVVAQAADLADVEDRHDVRVVQPGGGPRLVEEPPPARRVGRGVAAQHLQRHRPVEPDVDRLVDDPHAAAAQLADDPVAGDPPARLQPLPRLARLADQPLHQRQPLQSRAEVVAQVGIPRREEVRVGRIPRLGQREVLLDRLTQPLVSVGRFGLGTADHRFHLRLAVVSCQLSVLGRQSSVVEPLDERGEHPLDLDNFVFHVEVFAFFEEAQIVGQQEVIFQFAGRSHGDLEEASEIRYCPPSTSLGDVRRDRARTAPDLTREPVSLVARKPLRDPINHKSQSMSLLPNLKLPEILHKGIPATHPAEYHRELTTENRRLRTDD